MIILRSCNALLRRLSRAEDSVFCGRVFIFLFQSFPLGDKSSVNLRGEYHTENVTTFDKIPAAETTDTVMTDATAAAEGQSAQGHEPSQQQQEEESEKPSAEKKPDKKGAAADLYTLYPMFWGLQAYFSAPTKMFDRQQFATFKTGLEATLSTFQDINVDAENQGSSSRAAEDLRRAAKRRRMSDGQDSIISFNPKYLTSRDLFGLEVSSLFFFFC